MAELEEKVPRDQSDAPPLDKDQTAMLAELFRLLGDTSRLRIVMSCLAQAKSVTEISNSLGLSQSLVSHHLRLLRGARLVRRERRGKQAFYSADDDHVRRVVADLAQHVLEPVDEDEQ